MAYEVDYLKFANELEDIERRLQSAPEGPERDELFRRAVELERELGGESNNELSPATLAEIIAPPERNLVQTEDGFLVDDATGAVEGHIADLPDRPFEIKDDESADFALKLRSQIEGEIAGLQIRKAALDAEMDAVINRRRQKLAWWVFRFEPDLRRYSKTKLTGKAKTAYFNWGHVQFRDLKGTNKIISPEEALSYVETFAPELVKVKRWVDVTEVLEAAKRAEAALGEKQDNLGFIKNTGAETVVKITTGIKLDSK